jgi:hypothetical protein
MDWVGIDLDRTEMPTDGGIQLFEHRRFSNRWVDEMPQAQGCQTIMAERIEMF